MIPKYEKFVEVKKRQIAPKCLSVIIFYGYIK